MTKDYYRRHYYAPSSSRRLKIDIVVVVLQCVASMQHTKEKEFRVASPLYRICTAARMSYPQARGYLSLLRDAGLIRQKIVKFNLKHRSYTKPQRKVQVFHLTQKGNKFLQLHKMMLDVMPQEMLPSLELEVIS
jgi:predicted transcriptional regulator